ncbi:MAG: EAL domain-containing protein [Cellvibrionaceae bacterium]|nr:EAL domain-containing protein [Cellvibrionaceae bacterium]
MPAARLCYILLGYILLAIFFHSVAVPMAQALDLNRVKVHKLYRDSEVEGDTAYAVLRDSAGFLWSGTDIGLQRFDGYRFDTFKHDPDGQGGIGEGNTTVLLESKAGVLWAGGLTLSRFNPILDTFESFDISGKLRVRALYEDNQGLIWAGGHGFGLVAFDPASKSVKYRLLTDSKQQQKLISAMAPNANGDVLWLANYDGLTRFDLNSHEFAHFSLPGNFSYVARDVKDCIVSSQGEIWLATQRGLLVFNPESETFRRYTSDPGNPNALSTNNLWSVFEDSEQRIWIGTDKEGVHIYRSNTDDFQHVPSSASKSLLFPQTTVIDMFEDQRGSIWFALHGAGLRRISPGQEQFANLVNDIGHVNSLGFNNVLGIKEADDGRVLIATDGGGLDIYSPKTNSFEHYRSNSGDTGGLSSNSVIYIANMGHGKFWLGTWGGGINIFDINSGEFSVLQRDENAADEQTLGNNNIFKIYKDRFGWIWISVWQRGLQRYNPKTNVFNSYYTFGPGAEAGLSYYAIENMAEDSQGRLWVVSRAGLEFFDFDSQRFTRVPIQQLGSVNDLYIDPQDNLWLGHSGGFAKFNYDKNQFSNFSVNDGLSDNFVVSIERDAYGDFWLGTRSGLNRFNVEKQQFKSFDERDGLTDSQFNRYSHLITREGLIYFGGPKGLNVFRPGFMPENNQMPAVVLTNIELFQNPITIGDFEFLPKSVRHLETITLNYNQRDISFEFAVLDFISPSKNKYRYKLQGLESLWNHSSGRRRIARYTNLDPGSYQFKVQGSNSEGLWNLEGASINLVVLPPWWMTWWARLVFLAGSAVSVYSFIRWRLIRTIDQARELESIVEEKTHELAQANQYVLKLNSKLEDRVELRTKELTREIEARKNIEDKLYFMAFHDALTGLPNRAWLIQRLETLLKSDSDTKNKPFLLMFLDGDRFKQINDNLGHSLGDMLLVNVANRLKYKTPEWFQAVRLGGDEFTILIEDMQAVPRVEDSARLLIDLFDAPFNLDNNIVFFKVSIGLVVCRDDYERAEQVLRDADIAMYRAKEDGRGVYRIFDGNMRSEIMERAAIEADLYLAIEREELFLVYQPIVELESGDLIGFEALIRWRHANRGIIPPCKFIPIAEDNGFILHIGFWVLQTAVSQLAEWLKKFDFDRRPTMSINLSSLQLSYPKLIERIDEILDMCQIDKKLIRLEITESVLMQNTGHVNQMLDELRMREIDLAIDDFGTGYSSLSYLNKFPVQVLKIDSQFVWDMCSDNPSAESGAKEIVRATISLAHNLRLQVVAEGIETVQQLEQLKHYGCDFGQGYYIAKPLDSSDASAFISERFACHPDFVELPGKKAKVSSPSSKRLSSRG